MAASVHAAAATLMQPSKLAVSARSANSQLRSSQTLSKAFGLDSAAARITCSLHSDLKDVSRKFADAAKIAGFALATSALVVSVCPFFANGVFLRQFVCCYDSPCFKFAFRCEVLDFFGAEYVNLAAEFSG